MTCLRRRHRALTWLLIAASVHAIATVTLGIDAADALATSIRLTGMESVAHASNFVTIGWLADARLGIAYPFTAIVFRIRSTIGYATIARAGTRARVIVRLTNFGGAALERLRIAIHKIATNTDIGLAGSKADLLV